MSSETTSGPQLKDQQLVVQVTQGTRDQITGYRERAELATGTRPSEAEVVRLCIYSGLPRLLGALGE